jgi:hypothetical protein
MLISPVGLRSGKVCTGDNRQKLKTTDPTSHQRGRPTSRNPQLFKNYSIRKRKIGLGVPGGCMTPKETGRLRAGRNRTRTQTRTSTFDMGCLRTVGSRPEKECAGDAQQLLKTTDLTSRQRGRPTSTNL